MKELFTRLYNNPKMAIFIIVILGMLLIISGFALFKKFAQNENSSIEHDLSAIKKRGKIIALTDNSTTSYFVYKGEPMGYEYELLNSFAKELGLELDIIIAQDMNTIFEQLNTGGVDIVAANLTVTKERLKTVSFTEPLIFTKQILIQRKPENWQKMSNSQLERKLIRNPVDLAGKNVYVRKESSFYSRLLSLSEEIGEKINIIEAPGIDDTEELISKVANGQIDYTIADENIALINQAYYSNIDVKTAISLPQQIAWAIRKNAPELEKALNDWLIKKKGTNEYAVLYNKYFKNRREAEKRLESDFFSQTGGKISVYDDIIKYYSKQISWDWRLLASLVCQESRFNPTAQSWAGAYGLMQVIPSTSSLYGIDSLEEITPRKSLQIGTKYISTMEKYWEKHINDKNERLKFVLASYNVGLGHVIDARNLAIKYGKEPNVWDDNVSYYILQKSKAKYYRDPIVKCGYCRGEEPYKYVKEILNRYEHYKNVIEEYNTNESVAIIN